MQRLWQRHWRWVWSVPRHGLSTWSSQLGLGIGLVYLVSWPFSRSGASAWQSSRKSARIEPDRLNGQDSTLVTTVRAVMWSAGGCFWRAR